MRPVIKVVVFDEGSGKDYTFHCSKVLESRDGDAYWQVRCDELGVDTELHDLYNSPYKTVYMYLLEKERQEKKLIKEKKKREPRTFPELHDMRQSPWPEGAQRGDEWYTLQMYVCGLCGGKTNRVFMGGSPGTGPRRICPNAREKWHWQLEDMVDRLNEGGHPQSYYEELRSEFKKLKKQCREWVEDEILGEPDFSQIDEKTIISRAVRSF